MYRSTKQNQIHTARMIVKRWCEDRGAVFRNAPKTKFLLAAFHRHGGKTSGKMKNERLYNAAIWIDPNFKKPAKKRSEMPSFAATPKEETKFKAFYKSAEWRRVRYDVLAANDGRCELCGVSKHDGATLNVDHIRPLRLNWDRRLDRSNLQILCGACNHGKGNRDDTDWREPSLRVLMGEAMK